MFFPLNYFSRFLLCLPSALVQILKTFVSFLFLLIFFAHFYLFFILEDVYNYLTVGSPLFYVLREAIPLEGIPQTCGYSKAFVIPVPYIIDYPVLNNIFTLKNIYFYNSFLLFLSFFCSIFCFFSYFLSSIFSILCFFCCSLVFYQYLFFYFLGYSLESLAYFFSLYYFFDFFDILLNFTNNYCIKVSYINWFILVDKIILNYCILLDLDIGLLISPEILRLKIFIYRLFLNGFAENSILATYVLKHFFSKWCFMLPGETSYLFFVEFFLDEEGKEFLYFL